MRLPGSSSTSSAFPRDKWVGFFRFSPRTRFSADSFRGCSYSVMFKPPSLLASRSFLPRQVSLPGSRDFYIRAERASLPSHASDMLSARLQTIGGTRTFTSPGSQLCRLLLISVNPSSGAWAPITAGHGVHLPVSSSTSSAFPRTLARSALPHLPVKTIS